MKRCAFLVFTVFIFLFLPLTTPKAHALWPDIPGFNYKEMLEETFFKITGIRLGVLKQQAIQTISQQVDSMIAGGRGGNAQIITNWEDYLYKTPDNNTKLYMNDYLSRITSGRGSLGSYQSEGFGGGAGYAGQLVAIGKNNTINRKDPKFSYEGNPANMFSGNNFKNFMTYLSGINNPWAFDINAQREYLKKKEEERKLAETKAKAYLGGIGVGEGPNGKGTITLPGSVVVQTKANTMDLGNKVIASATHPEEVITALVSKILTQAMQQGISIVQTKLGNTGGLNNVLRGLTPSAYYNSGLVSGASTSASPPSSVPSDSLKYDPAYYRYYNDAASSSSASTSNRSSIPPPQRNF